MMTTFSYTKKVRWEFAVPAAASLVLLLVISWGTFYEGTPAYAAIRRAPLWVFLLAILGPWFLVVACVPSAWSRLVSFELSETSITLSRLTGTRTLLWQRLTEIQVARVPSPRNYGVSDQTVVRLYCHRCVAFVFDDIKDFHELIRQLDIRARQYGISLFRTDGVRRWRKVPIGSLLDELGQ